MSVDTEVSIDTKVSVDKKKSVDIEVSMDKANVRRHEKVHASPLTLFYLVKPNEGVCHFVALAVPSMVKTEIELLL